MTGEGGHDWEEDTQPDTVRAPTSRPPRPAASGVFEVARPPRGFLEPDGTVWPCGPDLPVPGEVRGPSTYGRG